MSNHLKAYAAPKSWTILRKVTKWIVRPNPGAHEMRRSMPIGLLLRQLKLAKAEREVRHILGQGAVLVDGKKVFDRHFSVGFMDVIKVGAETTVRCMIDKKGRLVFLPIGKDEEHKKVSRIVRKQTVPGGKVQLTLSDGRNLLKDKASEAVGDALVMNVPDQKVLDHIALKKGVTVMLMGGRHMGVVGQLESIDGAKIVCKSGSETFETLKEFAFIVGKEKPAVTVVSK